MTFDEADAAYPYRPGMLAEYFTGLAKLQAFEDPGMRRIIFDALSLPERARRERPDPRLVPASRAFLDTSEDDGGGYR